MGSLLKVINTSTILSWLGDYVGTVFADLGDFLLNALTQSVGAILWMLCDVFFWILDIFEDLFRAFAGTLEGGVNIQGEQVEGDIVLYLMQSDFVMQIFNSILILSLVLLIIFTIFAIAKNQYSEKQEPVSKIINSSVKALLMYLLVPIATIVCLLVGNIVLQAIDGATKTQSRTSASQMLFVTAAYNANKLRDPQIDDAVRQLRVWYGDGSIAKIEGKIKQVTGVTPDNIDQMITEEHPEKLETIASMVDEHFAAGDLTYAGNFNGKWNFGAVIIYYDSFRMSYITVWVGGAFLIWAIGKICWGLVSRVFKMTLYFAISPAIMATFPIDNGKALGSWRGEMVKQGTMVFASVGVLNVLYSILPAFNNLDIGTGIGGSIIKLFITIIAFSSAKDLVGAVSGWFGTGNAIDEGVKAKSQYTAGKKKLSGAAMKGVGVYGAYRGGAKAAGDQNKNKFWGGVAGMLSSTPLGKAAFGEEFEKQQKAGAASAKMFGTMAIRTEDREKKTAIWEGREAVAKEDKAIAIKLAQMEEVKQKQLAGLMPGSAEYKEVEDAWDKAMNKLKASASYLETLFETEKQDLESRKERLEKRQSNFTPVDNWRQANDQDVNLKTTIENMTGWTGMTDDIWKEVKQGDFRHVAGGYKKKVQEAYSMYASDIASIEHAKKNSLQIMENSANSGNVKFYQNMLGSNFSDVFDSKTQPDGTVKYEIKADYKVSVLDSAAKTEQDALNKISDQIKKGFDGLETKKLGTIGSLTDDQLEKIGKNSNKSS